MTVLDYCFNILYVSGKIYLELSPTHPHRKWIVKSRMSQNLTRMSLGILEWNHMNLGLKAQNLNWMSLLNVINEYI